MYIDMGLGSFPKLPKSHAHLKYFPNVAKVRVR